jgi:hypothetical protein
MTTTPVSPHTATHPAPLTAALDETEDAARLLSRLRRRLLAIGSLGAAAALVAAPAVAPWEGDGEWIATLAENPGTGQAGAVLYWLGFLLSLATVLSLTAMVRRRAVRLGLVGTVLALVGSAAQPGLLITDFFQLAMGEELPLDRALAVEDRMDGYVGLMPLYLVGFLGGVFGTALLVAAAWRAGWLHPIVPAIYVLAFVGLMLAPSEKAASVVGWSVMAAFHVLVAVRVLRATDDEWSTGLALPRDPR